MREKQKVRINEAQPCLKCGSPYQIVRKTPITESSIGTNYDIKNNSLFEIEVFCHTCGAWKGYATTEK